MITNTRIVGFPKNEIIILIDSIIVINILKEDIIVLVVELKMTEMNVSSSKEIVHLTNSKGRRLQMTNMHQSVT